MCVSKQFLVSLIVERIELRISPHSLTSFLNLFFAYRTVQTRTKQNQNQNNTVGLNVQLIIMMMMVKIEMVMNNGI
ncbi:MAG: hypothetical protein ACI8RD_004595 [Bacillariaceae sp.]|jgi:hypothetical protein